MDGRKLVYIAGKYSDPDPVNILANITRADAAGRKLYLMGYDVHIPHNNTANWERDPRIYHDRYPARILEMDLNILSRCDAIYLLRGWKESEGALSEFAKAKELGLEIWFEPEVEGE